MTKNATSRWRFSLYARIPLRPDVRIDPHPSEPARPVGGTAIPGVRPGECGQDPRCKLPSAARSCMLDGCIDGRAHHIITEVHRGATRAIAELLLDAQLCGIVDSASVRSLFK